MSAASLLVEIRTEELPPAQLWRLADAFPDLLLEELRKKGFADDKSQRAKDDNGNKFLATPRRLVALLQNIKSESAAKTVMRRGPQIAACKDSEGAPTKALIGFMQSIGATCENDLQQIEENGKTYIAWKSEEPPRRLANELAAVVEGVLLNLPAPRLMRWGDNDFKFIRPVRGILMIHGNEFIGGEVFGIRTGKTTKGHPVLCTKEIAPQNANEYESVMRESGKVIVDMDDRFLFVEEELRANAEKKSCIINLVPPYDADDSMNDRWLQIGGEGDLFLLSEVRNMCEMPAVYAGTMDGGETLPDFCIIECMIKHQRFFPLSDSIGKLNCKNYLLVADNAPENPETMIAGFDSVLRARLRDLQFYYDEDKKKTANDCLEKLKSVAYHNKLGSQFNRVCRLRKIADGIAALMQLNADDKLHLDSAVRVCKADLPTLMIGEYPELAGKMAAEYFCEKKTAEVVARHNAPGYELEKFSDDKLRRVYHALVLSDSLEKLAGMFGIGEKPDGSKDPHGLRAEATRIVYILLRMETELPGDKLLQIAAAAFDKLPHFDANEIWDFIAARAHAGHIGGHASAGGSSIDEMEKELTQKFVATRKIQNAVFAKRNFLLADIKKRYFAVSGFAGTDAAILIAANKRINNIFRKSGVEVESLAGVDESLFGESAERALYKTVRELRQKTDALVAKNDYGGALTLLCDAAAPTDKFFDEVLVNAEDEKIRANRFALLGELRALLNRVADISRLA